MQLSVLLVLGFCTLAAAQFPITCPSAARECCPQAHNGLRCGGPGRGQCVAISSTCDVSDPASMAWATTYFDRVCVCEDRFDGAGCDECATGWKGVNCSTPNVVIALLQLAKVTPSNFTISGGVHNLSVYDYFAWQHYYTMMAPGYMNINYAHEGPGFPTWHRRYLVQFEKALQRLSNNPSTFIPYWDWSQSTNASAPNGVHPIDPVITRFGGDGQDDGVCRSRPDAIRGFCNCTLTTGPFAHWTLVGTFGLPCRAGGECGPGVYDYLSRGIGCDATSPNLPTGPAVDWLVTQQPTFDTPPWNTTSQTSFRNLLEGFSLTPYATLPANTTIGHGRDLHNRVHVFVGGTMCQVPAAANDPIFWSHHAYVDLIFERWLRNFPDAAGPPTSGAPVGHNQNECLTPLLPLVTHRETYQISTALGYDYDYFATASSSSGSALSAGAIAGIAVAGAVVVGGVVFYFATRRRSPPQVDNQPLDTTRRV